MDEQRLTGEEMARIWQRVSPGSSPPEHEDRRPPAFEAERLRGFIRMEREFSDNYRFLARKVRGKPESAAFARMAEETERTEKRLSAEYFMLTGDVYTPKTAPNLGGGLLRSLREMYLKEIDAERAFRRAAETAPDGHLAAVYRDAADASKRRAIRLRAMIGRQLG